jgi:hypothetical protein
MPDRVDGEKVHKNRRFGRDRRILRRRVKLYTLAATALLLVAVCLILALGLTHHLTKY